MLRGRRKGVVCKSESYANRGKLTKVEEEELREWMDDMMYLGLAPQKLHIRNMADEILAGRANTTPITVGIKWVDNFKARSGNLKVRLSRPKDRKRLLAENPEIMAEWFRLVRRTIHTPPGSPVSGDAELDPETPKNIKELHRHRDITDKLFASGDASPRVLQRRYHQSIKRNPRKTRATGQRKCRFAQSQRGASKKENEI
ncbi:Tc5 transposase DNA-binding domain-containing protein [Metschnikowia aff. pulcherrima]|uniref:Tc5 transposase DNA-binding domain-containing protein n=1 Tax=Metschnikowia aff. pulcherrima TaxID=2163413 RepID=A0A4P6XMG5_9ASCO|nr:Tc5 transposase DNA-binding domain-containing protein [Metschnikowia aff. pulcherrima]